ncbi:MAG: transglycosylase domain-containing protein [Bifidobacteriaceae bacterium]|jgi:membrane peptidoglycan carboxypeptidase|nr:transglycosylase domain-containing protein [Bifidobacteriaceae bacterium]
MRIFVPQNKLSIQARNKFFLSLILISITAGIVFSTAFIPFTFGLNLLQAKVSQDGKIDKLEDAVFQPLPEQSVIYANDKKTKLATFYIQNRKVVPLSQISQYLQHAVIAREDRRFYSHTGVDLVGIARAVISNFGGEKEGTQGGSTLTQQYIKNTLIDLALQQGDPIQAYKASEQTLFRKIREAQLAIEVDNRLSKNEILQGYLNVAPFGQQVYGAETAAEHYFSKSAKDLNLVEAATIAAVTKSPAAYDPTKHPEAAKEQRNLVLDLMAEIGYISRSESTQAKEIDLKSTLKVQDVKVGCQAAGSAAFFCDYVQNVILADSIFGQTESQRRQFLFTGGLKIYSTLDPKAQKSAQDQVDAYIPGADPSGLGAALSAVQPRTGKILAMAQNKPYDPAGATPGSTAINYNVPLALGGSGGFSPGSTWKPFVLATWLKNGYSLNATMKTGDRKFLSSQFACASPGETWDLHNATSISYDNQTPLVATEQSNNVPFAVMATKLGLCDIVQTAKSIGYQGATASTADIAANMTDIPPTTIIGVGNATPLNMADSYATFAAGGMHCDPVAIDSIVKSDGSSIPVPPPNCQRAIGEDVANAVTYALEHVITSGLARGFDLDGGRAAALKTGTAEANHHIWACGYTPQVATAVWVGNPNWDQDLQNMTINGVYKYVWYGLDLPVPIWQHFMNSYLQGQPNQDFLAIDPKYLIYTFSDAGSNGPQPSPSPSPSESNYHPEPEPKPSVSPSPTPTPTPTPKPTPTPTK